MPVAERPKAKGSEDFFRIPDQIWKGNHDFQIRAAFCSPKHKLKSRLLASAIDSKVMNFRSKEKISLAPVIKELRMYPPVFDSPGI